MEYISFDLFLLPKDLFSVYCFRSQQLPRLSLGKTMQQQANEKILPEQFQVEVPEIKKSLPLRKIDEELSEFERARQASKTWSMGQD